MNCFINYERLNPDTVSGERLKVTFHYSTFDIEEMNKFENGIKESICNGVSARTIIKKSSEEEE